jgi:peptidoglycan/LPS O-acetylase OafA/YrhL
MSESQSAPIWAPGNAQATHVSPPRHSDRRHIHEIDIVRILTFACVIGVHTVSYTAGSDDTVLRTLLGLLHFTREAFFWITGFVLMWSYFHKPVPMRRFWPRRFLLVGVPYLVWSAIYVLIDWLQNPSPAVALVVHYLVVVGEGRAWYHLYFLLVTMQIYLLVPALAWLVRHTRRHHKLLLVLAALAQAALMSWYHYWPQFLPGFVTYDKQYFFSYIFFIFAGAVCADRGDAFFNWVTGHRKLIAVITAATCLVTLAVFWAQHALGGESFSAMGDARATGDRPVGCRLHSGSDRDRQPVGAASQPDFAYDPAREQRHRPVVRDLPLAPSRAVGVAMGWKRLDPGHS